MMNVNDATLQALSDDDLDAQLIQTLRQIDASTAMADTTLTVLRIAHERARGVTHDSATRSAVHLSLCELLRELHADSVEQDFEQRVQYLDALLACVCDGCDEGDAMDRQHVIRSIETYVREYAAEHDHGAGVDAQALADDALWQFAGFDLVDLSEAEVRAIVERILDKMEAEAADRQYVIHGLQAFVREHLAEYDHEEAIAIFVRILDKMEAEAADRRLRRFM